MPRRAACRPTHPARECQQLLRNQFDPTLESTRCALLGPTLWAVGGSHVRWITVPTGTDRLVISVEGFTRQHFDAVRGPAQSVLDTLRIGS